MAVLPVFLGAIVCRNAVRDPDTQKFHLLGVSDYFAVPTLPARIELTLFLSLIEVNGVYQVEVRIVDVAEDDSVIYETAGRLEGNDPIAVFQFSFPAFSIEFFKPGEYRLQLMIDGEIIIERRLTVRLSSGGDHG